MLFKLKSGAGLFKEYETCFRSCVDIMSRFWALPIGRSLLPGAQTGLCPGCEGVRHNPSCIHQDAGAGG